MARFIVMPLVFAVILASVSLSAQAQMYPLDLHSSQKSRWSGVDMSAQQSFTGMGMDGTSAFLQRRDEDERDRRETRERQRRLNENFTNLPDQLREPYPRRADTPYGAR
jgi:hypothetical protein